MTTREDFFSGTVNLYKKTGQGFPGIFKYKAQEVIDGLIAEGLLIEVQDTRISDTFICVVGVYCVETDETPNALAYIRRYLDIEEEGFFKRDWTNPALLDAYDEWLALNKADIDKIHDIKLLGYDSFEATNPSDSLSEDELNVIKGYAFHSNNVTAEEAIKEVDVIINTNDELIPLYVKAIKLGRDYQSELDKAHIELSAFKKLRRMLVDANDSELIHDIIK